MTIIEEIEEKWDEASLFQTDKALGRPSIAPSRTEPSSPTKGNTRSIGPSFGRDIGDHVVVTVIEMLPRLEGPIERVFPFVGEEGSVREGAMKGVPGLVGLEERGLVPLLLDFLDDRHDGVVVARGEQPLRIGLRQPRRGPQDRTWRT